VIRHRLVGDKAPGMALHAESLTWGLPASAGTRSAPTAACGRRGQSIVFGERQCAATHPARSPITRLTTAASGESGSGPLREVGRQACAFSAATRPDRYLTESSRLGADPSFQRRGSMGRVGTCAATRPEEAFRLAAENVLNRRRCRPRRVLDGDRHLD